MLKTRKTVGLKRVAVTLLSLVLMLSMFAMAGAPAVKASSDLLSDDGIESDFWSSGNWSLSAVSGNYWDKASLSWYAYADDSYITAQEGDYCLKYYLSSAVTSSYAIK